MKLLLAAGACGLACSAACVGHGPAGEGAAEAPPVFLPTPRAPGSPTIGDIMRSPETYRGKEVSLSGSFRGWSGAVGPPPVSRSDWVLKDDTGAIYVNGPFPPGCVPPMAGMGSNVRIRGTVRTDARGRAYISKGRE
jgi:hypothetical protein